MQQRLTRVYSSLAELDLSTGIPHRGCVLVAEAISSAAQRVHFYAHFLDENELKLAWFISIVANTRDVLTDVFDRHDGFVFTTAQRHTMLATDGVPWEIHALVCPVAREAAAREYLASVIP